MTHYNLLRMGLYALACGNAVTLLSACYWFPASGFDIFNIVHVRWVFVAVFLTIIVFGLAAVSLLARRRYQLATCTVALLGAVRLLPARLAIDAWPGGDDGSRMGWELVVVPSMWVLAIVGAACCLSCWRSLGRTGCSAVPRLG